MLTFASYDDSSNEINKGKGFAARSLRPSHPLPSRPAAFKIVSA
jgi:hypothetical protein